MRVDEKTAGTPAEVKIRRALLSVFDKTGLVELARGLAMCNVELLASGGTATAIEKAGLKVTRIEAFTGAKEMLDGRVKTLHPRIHAGLLADRRIPEHVRDLEQDNLAPIDLVVCNLYPFEQVLAQGAARHVMVENIDIGGPAMVRAAAKNADGGVAVVMDPVDYPGLLTSLQREGGLSGAERRRLAGKAFKLIAQYDALIAGWYERDLATSNGTDEAPQLPANIDGFTRIEVLRYGENPHQAGALYRAADEASGVACGTLLSGKQLSYNNLLDMDAAYRAVFMLASTGCAIVKHTNPCGLAEADTQGEAFVRALSGDPVSAFGGIIGFNGAVELATVHAIKSAKLFVECIVAPAFTPEALAELKQRENLRLFQVPSGSPEPRWHGHRIGGGMLAETADPGLGDTGSWKVVSKRGLDEGWMAELAFAMRAAMVLKSNAIAVTKGRKLMGAGAGFMSRVDAVRQALDKAGEAARGAFLGSDAFFPFDDNVRLAHQAGIVAIVQPGGSKRDDEVVATADALGLAMVFTGRRHFRH